MGKSPEQTKADAMWILSAAIAASMLIVSLAVVWSASC